MKFLLKKKKKYNEAQLTDAVDVMAVVSGSEAVATNMGVFQYLKMIYITCTLWDNKVRKNKNKKNKPKERKKKKVFQLKTREFSFFFK